MSIQKEHHIAPKSTIEKFKIGGNFFASQNKGDGWSNIELRNPDSFSIKHLYNLWKEDSWDSTIEKRFGVIEDKLSTIIQQIESLLNNVTFDEDGKPISDSKLPSDFDKTIIEYIELLYKKIGIYKVLHHFNFTYGLHSGRDDLTQRNSILQRSFDNIKFPWPSRSYKIAFIESKPGNEFLVTDSPLFIHPSNKNLKKVCAFTEDREVSIPISGRWIVTIHPLFSSKNISIPRISFSPWKDLSDESYMYVRTKEPNNLLVHNAFWFIGGGNKELVEHYVDLKKNNKIYQYKKEEAYSETEILKTDYFLKMIGYE